MEAKWWLLNVDSTRSFRSHPEPGLIITSGASQRAWGSISASNDIRTGGLWPLRDYYLTGRSALWCQPFHELDFLNVETLIYENLRKFTTIAY